MLPHWKDCCVRVPQRWVLATMGCLAIANSFTMRICLSLAITEMVETSGTSNGTVTDETCPSSESTSSSSISGGTYKWDEYKQGIILSSFYWGYIVSLIPGGILAEKFGGKYTLGLGILSASIFTLLTPIAVQTYGSTGLIILRVLVGFSEGPTQPTMTFLVSQWAPPDERSKIGTLGVSGSAFGTALGNALTGLLISYSSIGWPIPFYFFGAVGILWFVAWVVLCYSHPDEHPFISDKEKNYLHKTMNEHTHKETKPTPWRHIMTSVPVWALVIGQFGYGWGFYAMTTDLPKYMSSVLKFSIKANGLLTAIPYILQVITANVFAWVADWLIESGKLSRTNVRKTWFTVSLIVPSIFIISASYAGCDRTVVVILFTVGLAFMGLMFSSSCVNPNDLSPNYSGTIRGIATVSGTLAGILVPYVVGIITPNQTLSEWRFFFWITFVIFWLATLIFNIWGQGDVQFWNNRKTKDNRKDEVESKSDAPENIVSSSKLP